jgi:hypothetical protein
MTDSKFIIYVHWILLNLLLLLWYGDLWTSGRYGGMILFTIIGFGCVDVVYGYPGYPGYPGGI